ncbi:exonuclease domain-containing protein, partial [Salmonella enterica]|uniref:exonuclease domain-containing protein n=1 Tax=Salmonella enterica TaxID=28901 RepID=UPI003D2DB0BA
IGCLELINHIPTGRQYHQYINPEREVPEEAVRVHGLTWERLKTEPVFAQVADAFLEFVQDSPLVIHNASFDMGFINHELGLLG